MLDPGKWQLCQSFPTILVMATFFHFFRYSNHFWKEKILQILNEEKCSCNGYDNFFGYELNFKICVIISLSCSLPTAAESCWHAVLAEWKRKLSIRPTTEAMPKFITLVFSILFLKFKSLEQIHTIPLESKYGCFLFFSVPWCCLCKRCQQTCHFFIFYITFWRLFIWVLYILRYSLHFSS